MENSGQHSIPRHHLLRLSEKIRENLAKITYKTPESASISVKSALESLLPSKIDESKPEIEEFRDFLLCCVAIASAEGQESPTLFWIPKDLILEAKTALGEVSRVLGFVLEGEMVTELMPELLPAVKGVIKETCVDIEDEDFVQGSAKAPVGYAILAAHQFRWLVGQVGYPDLGKLLWLVIPCALTALDHWSTEVKEQGLISFLHIAKSVNKTEISWYEEAVLDACCRNVPAADELWHHVVEVSVILLTYTQQDNPRSPWYNRMMNEMLSHLERQPLNKERRISWLTLIEPVLNSMGLFILAHFRHIFHLFFEWMHTDDEKTVLLVLERLHNIIRLTWIRKSPYFERLIDELVLLYKETAMRKNREVLRTQILQLLVLLQKCKGLQFETSWNKYRNDPDLTMLVTSFNNLLDV